MSGWYSGSGRMRPEALSGGGAPPLEPGRRYVFRRVVGAGGEGHLLIPIVHRTSCEDAGETEHPEQERFVNSVLAELSVSSRVGNPGEWVFGTKRRWTSCGTRCARGCAERRLVRSLAVAARWGHRDAWSAPWRRGSVVLVTGSGDSAFARRGWSRARGADRTSSSPCARCRGRSRRGGSCRSGAGRGTTRTLP